MATYKETFVVEASYKKWSFALMAVGVVTLLLGSVFLAGDHKQDARFWSSLLYNSVFFLLVTNASMFFICATTLAMGGWQMVFRRIPEAISTCVKILGPITFIILMCILFLDKTQIYHWLDDKIYGEFLANGKPNPNYDVILDGKHGFLNKNVFIIYTVLTLAGWIGLGLRMRKLSKESDTQNYTLEEGKKYIYKNTVSAALFIVWFALTVASVTPWIWIMSIDAHWYSTMFSWYNFASTFVSGMSLVAIYFIYLKTKGYLEYATEEHLHDIGKFMFAFSVFWTYLWFSQFMLIWYANIPEETVYFKQRSQGAYRGIFFLNLIINFLAPLLILMKRGAKRNYMLITIMACIIIFGHWVDYFQMVQPGVVNNINSHIAHEVKHSMVGQSKAVIEAAVTAAIDKEGLKPTLSWFEFGIAAGFIGIIMFATGRALAKAPLLAKGHPFTKESLIHHT